MQELQLVKTDIIMYTGHSVYESLGGAGNYIISGYLPMRYINGDVEPSLYDYLREEAGTRRIRVYKTAEEVITADRLREDGNNLLSGAKPAITRAIILNGSLVEGVGYTIDHEDRLLVPVAEVFAAYGYNAGFSKDVGAVLSYNYTGHFFPTINTSASYRETYKVSGGQWTYTNSDPANFWADRFNCIWEGGCIELETLNRVLGWTWEFVDGMLVITSCEEDLNPLNVCLPPAQFQDYDVYYPEDIKLAPGDEVTSSVSISSEEVDISDNSTDKVTSPLNGEG